jgi:serine/threonine protein kinase
MKEDSKEMTNKLIDELGNIFIKGELLSEGGQGKVYRVEDDDTLIIKECIDALGDPIKDKKKIKQQNDSFLDIRLLPLKTSSNIVLPLTRLKNSAGYIMKFLQFMEPLDKLFKVIEPTKTEVLPDWLARLDKNMRVNFYHYSKTGATRKRIEILSKTAAELAKIHLSGLVYCDLSFNNIYFSDTDNSVCFIDSDNLIFDGLLEKHMIFTPGYGAPEVESLKASNSAFGDCYSFAIIAYKLLTLESHTDSNDFKVLNEEDVEGVDFEEEEEVGWDDEVIEDDSLKDEVEAKDGSSMVDCIMDYDLFCLFKDNFMEGKNNITKRPSMLSWAQSLSKASDQLITCDNCHMDYNYDASFEDGMCTCPFCGTKLKKCISIERWNDSSEINNTDPIYQYYHEVQDNQTIIIPNRVFGFFDIETFNQPSLSLRIEGDDLIITKDPLCSSKLILTNMSFDKNLFKEYKTDYRIPIPKDSSKDSYKSLLIINNDEYKFILRLRIIEY